MLSGFANLLVCVYILLHSSLDFPPLALLSGNEEFMHFKITMRACCTLNCVALPFVGTRARQLDAGTSPSPSRPSYTSARFTLW